MDNSKDVIMKEFEAAKEKFPQLCQDPKQFYDFTIIFPDKPNYQYLIRLPSSYPTDPPVLFENQEQFPTPLTTIGNWSKVFQLEHVIKQIQLRNQNLPSAPIIVDQKSIRNSILSFKNKLQDESERKKLINTIPQVKEANDKLKNALEKSHAKQEEASRLCSNVKKKADMLLQLNEERLEIESTLNCVKAPGPSMMIEARKAKASEYKKLALSKDDEIDQLQQRVKNSSEKIPLNTYLNELKNLYQQKHYYNLLADSIEKPNDNNFAPDSNYYLS